MLMSAMVPFIKGMDWERLVVRSQMRVCRFGSRAGLGGLVWWTMLNTVECRDSGLLGMCRVWTHLA
jgi:hypothetical protein